MAFHYKSILFLGITLLLPVTNGFAATPVSICGEPWPPFLYETGGDKQENKDIAGIHLENFQLLAELTGLEFTFDLLPWKRCMFNVENYAKPGDHEIAIDASFNTERAEKFHLVGPMYAMGTAVFYSRKRFPDGPLSKKTGRVISWINEMQHFSICGLLGWNYEMYYVEHGIPRSNKVIRSPAGYQGMFSMLSKGRCELVETHPALVLGEMISGELEMPKGITCSKLNEEPEKFYLMVSRKSPRAEELVTRLSTALIYLKRTLQWKSIEDKGVLPASEFTDVFKECL
jgi:polar amino acid transport system substrate-binding protein